MPASREAVAAKLDDQPRPAWPGPVRATSNIGAVDSVNGSTTTAHLEADGSERVLSRRVPVGNAAFVETVCRRGLRSPVYAYRGPCLTLVVSGRYSWSGSGADVCTPPAVVFDPVPGMHLASFDNDGGRCFSLEVDARMLAEHGSNGLDRQACYWEGGRLAWIMARMYREFRLMDDLSLMTLQGLALHVVAAASRGTVGAERTTEPGWLDDVQAILRARFTAPPPLKDIASLVGVHPVSLARGFRRRFGLSPGAYARLFRLEYASRELASTDRPVMDIASAAGFANKSHLTRTFKLQSGMTPHAYRRLFRQGHR